MAIKYYKQENGTYAVRVWAKCVNVFGLRPNKYKSGFRSLAVAKQWAMVTEAEISEGRQDKDISFCELYNLYKETRGPRMSPTTLSSFKYSEKIILPYFGKIKIKDINTRIVQSFVNELLKKNPDLKAASIKKYTGIVMAVINYGVGQDYLEYNKIKRLELPRDEDPFIPTILPPKKLMEILISIKQNFYNIYIPCLLALTMSPSRSEALGIRKDAVDLDNCVIRLETSLVQADGKLILKDKLKARTRKRVLALSEFVKNEIKEHLEKYTNPDDPMLCSTIFLGGCPPPQYVSHEFHNYVLEVFGISMRFHDLRQNFSQLADELGTDVVDRAAALGHSNTKTTIEHYTLPSVRKNKKINDNVVNALLTAAD